jgi:hypothetical protein
MTTITRPDGETFPVDDLATLSELARHLDVPRSTLTSASSRAETSGFPAPVIDIPSARLFSIKEVLTWWDQ